MAKFNVTVKATVNYETTVEVEAASKAEAESGGLDAALENKFVGEWDVMNENYDVSVD